MSQAVALQREERDAPRAGISSQEAAARLTRYGPNVLAPHRPRRFVLEFLARFRNPLVLLLLAASAVSALTGEVAKSKTKSCCSLGSAPGGDACASHPEHAQPVRRHARQALLERRLLDRREVAQIRDGLGRTLGRDERLAAIGGSPDVRERHERVGERVLPDEQPGGMLVLAAGQPLVAERLEGLLHWIEGIPLARQHPKLDELVERFGQWRGGVGWNVEEPFVSEELPDGHLVQCQRARLDQRACVEERRRLARGAFDRARSVPDALPDRHRLAREQRLVAGEIDTGQQRGIRRNPIALGEDENVFPDHLAAGDAPPDSVADHEGARTGQVSQCRERALGPLLLVESDRCHEHDEAEQYRRFVEVADEDVDASAAGEQQEHRLAEDFADCTQESCTIGRWKLVVTLRREALARLALAGPVGRVDSHARRRTVARARIGGGPSDAGDDRGSVWTLALVTAKRTAGCDFVHQAAAGVLS